MTTVDACILQNAPHRREIRNMCASLICCSFVPRWMPPSPGQTPRVRVRLASMMRQLSSSHPALNRKMKTSAISKIKMIFQLLTRCVELPHCHGPFSLSNPMKPRPIIPYSPLHFIVCISTPKSVHHEVIQTPFTSGTAMSRLP